MKFDNRGCLVRESGLWPGNCGDSAAETCRSIILGDDRGSWIQFVYADGFLRHPSLSEVWGGFSDFSGDQFVPLVIASGHHASVLHGSMWRIRGTKALLAPAAWFLVRKWYVPLNVCNAIQGLFFRLPFRWSDSKMWFEKSDGAVADYLNHICIFVFLRRIGKWATLNQPKERCMAAVRKYYLEGPDAEPNAEWIVEMFEKALKE